LNTLPSSTRIWPRLAWLGAYAVAMGLLEAICVIYLRRLLPGFSAGSGSPIPALDRMRIEVIREACTIIMLVAVAWMSGINGRSRIACFFYAFGIWDIVYYAGLRWLANWPGSWLEWDCLFLIPKPWYGPVLAPVLISAYFALACVWMHAIDPLGKLIRLSITPIAAQVIAGFCWYWSFVKDAEQIMSHGYAGVTYSWPLFAAGTVIAMAGLWIAQRDPRRDAVPSVH
jgi:hypothetical protein